MNPDRLLEAWSVPCPACAAARGAPCRSKSSQVAYRRFVHAERSTLAGAVAAELRLLECYRSQDEQHAEQLAALLLVSKHEAVSIALVVALTHFADLEAARRSEDDTSADLARQILRAP